MRKLTVLMMLMAALLSGSFFAQDAAGGATPASVDYREMVANAPWMTRLSDTSVTIGVEFKEPKPCAVRYAASGEKSVVICTQANGLMRKQKVHRFELTGLKADTEYSYAILMLDEASAQEIEVAKGIFCTNPGIGVDHVFYAVSDNQVPPKVRINNFNAMFQNCGMDTANFLVSLGDLTSGFDDFRGVYFTSFFDVLAANGYARQAQLVRGNHEYRGAETDLYYDCFGTGYYAFSYGEVFYIVLDTMEDKGVHKDPNHYTLRNVLEPYIAEQAAWLEKIVASEACQKAKRRIVLAHTVPFPFENGFYYNNIKTICGKYFFGPKPLCKIDLWLAADIHCPYRFDPVTQKFYGAKRPMADWKRKAFLKMDRAQFSFPVYVNDGPGGAGVDITVTKVAVGEEGIRLTQLTPEGTVQDDVTLPYGKEAVVHSTTFVDYDAE